MELIDQKTKKIMEGCKERARDAGLSFQDESLEYIVSNRDLLELSPKNMIPTLYDFWVHDVEVLKEKGKYELYPGNPYETVINTRPAISFYNDNNPDWLNVMIFYHVIGHIDFFQNNVFFKHTWDYDFTGEALSDKRLISKFRSEHGRFLDYVIEFARSIDNLVGYHRELSDLDDLECKDLSKRLNYYFDVFLQEIKSIKVNDYIKEIERYNKCLKENKEHAENVFFAEIETKYPEFEALYKKSIEKKTQRITDVVRYIIEHSTFLNRENNKWMKSVIEVVRKTALFFQPQIRTKIMNEGWASYWHEVLFLNDDRIKGHEVDFARVNAGVTALPRVGLNPYALGMRMFSDIEENANKGKDKYDFERIQNIIKRKDYDQKTNQGKQKVFDIRKNLCDFMFINLYIDQDFVNKHKLFVAGKRMNRQKMVWEYFVKTKDAGAYRNMVLSSLYHPPCIEVNSEKNKGNTLYLVHRFEEKPLVKEYIFNTMMGIAYLWGGPVQLETSEALVIPKAKAPKSFQYFFGSQVDESEKPDIKWQRVVYTMFDHKLTKKIL
ncbi:stage V sporulation protein R [Candidatus Magnetomorum sp. HK-1]|nr:stage V sporulation protein R [Candidatus Magnetomorum sp. HK-1]